MAEPAVDVVAAPALYDLRRKILRGGDPAADVREPRDDDDETLHLAVLDGGRVVACGSFYAGTPTADGLDYQLRFLAVDDGRRGEGLASRLVARAEVALVERGATGLWANARDSALGFYEATGWRVVEGSAFVSDATGLPHHVVVKPLR